MLRTQLPQKRAWLQFSAVLLALQTVAQIIRQSTLQYTLVDGAKSEAQASDVDFNYARYQLHLRKINRQF